MKRFGERLREYREGRLSLRQFAKTLGWTPPYVCDIELGRRNPPAAEKIREMCEILKVDCEELLRLAELEKKRVELPLNRNAPERTEFALALARSWDSLSEEKIAEFKRLLFV